MGGGSWTTKSFNNYITCSRGVSIDEFESSSLSSHQVYRNRRLADALRPYRIVRECVDSEEHPNTVPVILALDVTGSMGDAAVKVAQKLNQIMTDIYSDETIKDVEFCVMGIGDLACDSAPIQMSQFESDIRIAEQLDQIYFEGGGGGNSYESYSAAWYMGLNHCDLDCWKRGKKGIIITLGDELPNPYLPKEALFKQTGDNPQGSIDTEDLKELVTEKFDIYHISINDRSSSYDYNNRRFNLDKKWTELIGDENYFVCGLDNLASTITDIIIKKEKEKDKDKTVISTNENGEIIWDI